MAECIEQGNVVKEYRIGNTIIKICDDYCRNKTPEEIDAILKCIAQNAQSCLSAAAIATTPTKPL